MQIFSYLYDKALILKRSLILLEQYKYQNLIQKKIFLQSRQMKVSSYTGVWYKNV